MKENKITTKYVSYKLQTSLFNGQPGSQKKLKCNMPQIFNWRQK